MAHASRKHFGAGAQGKRDGTGADVARAGGGVGPNAVLSNRDKAKHPKTRGQDSKRIQADQLQDTESNKGGE